MIFFQNNHFRREIENVGQQSPSLMSNRVSDATPASTLYPPLDEHKEREHKERDHSSLEKVLPELDAFSLGSKRQSSRSFCSFYVEFP